MDEIIRLALSNLPDFTHAAIDVDALRYEMTAGLQIEPQPQPRLYQLETTSRCNLRCGFCPRTIQLVPQQVRDLNAVMPLDRFEAVLDQFPQLRSIELFHFGEPFMHPDFERYIAACKRRGIYVVVASNLLPATPAKLDAAFAAGLDFLVMDIDSLDPARYAALRVGGRLDLLRERVVYILAKPRAERPHCVAQTILVDGQPEYTEAELLQWTGGLAPDEVRYEFYDSFRGTVTDKGGLRAEDVCREPFYGCTIHVNGNVVPCDRDWAGEAVMGNIFQEPMEAIWMNEKFQAFRDRMRSPHKPDICQKCAEGRLFNARSQPHIVVNMFKGAEIEVLPARSA